MRLWLVMLIGCARPVAPTVHDPCDGVALHRVELVADRPTPLDAGDTLTLRTIDPNGAMVMTFVRGDQTYGWTMQPSPYPTELHGYCVRVAGAVLELASIKRSGVDAARATQPTSSRE